MQNRRHLGYLSLSIKTAIALGFAVTLGIWVVAGYDFSTRVTNTRSQSALTTERYMFAEEILTTVRAQVLQATVYLRDAMLDPNPAKVDYRGQAEGTYAVASEALRNYAPIWNSADERDRVGQLQQALTEFRQTMLAMLATDSTRWRSEASSLLRTYMIPKRDAVFRISEEAQSANLTALVKSQAEVAGVYSATERRFGWSVGLALVGSLAIALLAVYHTGRLETGLLRQRLAEEQSARELQQLSSRLITVQEEERRRMARELHDEVGQGLMAIRVELSVAQNMITAAGVDAHILEDVRSITEGALATIRDLSHRLHPALLDDLGLLAALEWHVREFSRRCQVRIDIRHINMGDRLATDIESSVYRIVQEALTNVAKHARATTCRLTLQRLPTTLLVTLVDDGIGFNPSDLERPDPDRGLGLIGIRERATQLQGTVRVDSEPGRGTRITVQLPARPRVTVTEHAVSNAQISLSTEAPAHG